jgi:hypothetical protein
MCAGLAGLFRFALARTMKARMLSEWRGRATGGQSDIWRNNFERAGLQARFHETK